MTSHYEDPDYGRKRQELIDAWQIRRIDMPNVRLEQGDHSLTPIEVIEELLNDSQLGIGMVLAAIEQEKNDSW